jgi:subtilase family serine protease
MKKNLEALLHPLSAAVLAISVLVLSVFLPAAPAGAQPSRPLQPRIAAPIDDSSRVTLPGTRASHSFLAHDIGPVDPATPLHAIALDFNLTPQQKADLDSLTAAQQDIKSPLYHQWLTPEQFGARFGLAAGDIAAVESWLKLHGFTIDRTARANNRIVFSGTAAQVEAAFGAAIHNFQSRDGSIHFAPANDLALPSALAASVMAVRNLSNYLPKPHLKKAKAGRARPRPQFTDGNEPAGVEYALTPLDLATIYDVNKAYAAGFTGAGQTIAIVGQSYVPPSDISTFQSLAGVTAKAPVYVLVPGTGTPLLVQGDESESDIDLEYSSTIAKGAQVYFVYTGSYMTGVGESLAYAVDERIASIVSTSYGACEVDQAEGATSAATEIADQDLIYEQGIAQGQTFLASSGDDGSVDCIEDTGDALSTLQSAAVDYPASSPYNTAMGGTEFPLADYTTNASTYWLSNTKGGAPLVSSAKSYIPEQVWNDDDPYYGTSAGGGGSSLYEASPTWQTPGTMIGGAAIPTVAKITIGSGRNATTAYPRLVPDISLFASPDDPGLLICSSDPSAWDTGQQGSCGNGFYDSTGGYLTIYGGTSFGGPIFAGMLAIINQSLSSTGQGNINSTLYSIASSSTATYASVFHDITSGTNACYDSNETEPGYPAPPAPMPGICGVGVAVTEFSAGTGYDMASGLGTVDLYNLLTAWPKPAAASLLATTTTLTPATGTPALSASDAITITVASTTPPTGTVSVSVDNVVVSAALALTNGSATYNFASGVLGTHIVSATYSDDSTHAASSGLATLYVGTTTPSFSIAASSVTLVHGSTATSTVTITPAGGYTGLVYLTLTAPSSLANACAVFPASQSVTSAAAVPVAFTIYTNSNNCPSGATTLASIGHAPGASGDVPAPLQSPWKRAPLPAALTGVLIVCSFRRRARRLRSIVSFLFVATVALAAMGISGCTPGATLGSATSAVSTTSSVSAAGTYTLTVTASDSTNPTLSSTATITLTVQ